MGCIPAGPLTDSIVLHSNADMHSMHSMNSICQCQLFDRQNIHRVETICVVHLQAEQYLSFAKRISPRNMQLLLKASGYIMLLITLLRQPTNYMKQHPMIFWALVMLFIALMLRWFGWI